MNAQNPGQMLKNSDPYKAEWKEIDSLAEQGLPQSALEKVTTLYERAKTDNNPVQQAKAAIRIGQFKGQLSEEGEVATIAYLKAEEEQAPFPVNAIFQSVLGEWYMSYLRNQIWRIRQRTSTTEDPGDDITTWSVEQLLEKSTEYYLASISRIEELKALPIEYFDAITVDGKNTDNLRPTLLDFLAHRAIDHFSNEITYITQPAYQFTINETEALAPVANFIDHNFATEDSLSFPYLTLRLLQQVLALHQNDDDPAALIDADLKRLQLMHSKAVLPEKDSLYKAALTSLAGKYEDQAIYTEIISKLAGFKVELGRRYQNERNEAYRWEIKEAYELCQQAIEKYPKSYGAIPCKNLQTSIRARSLDLNMEKVNVPVQPSLLKVSYNNISEVFLQVIRISDPDAFSEMEYNDKMKFVNRQKPIESWSQKLPDEGDFQFHSVELAVPVLDIGHYAIVVADESRIKEGKTTAAFIETTVSQLAYLHRQNETNESEFVVVNRSSGAPVSGVKAEFYTRLFNRQKRKYELNKIGQSTSDENGFVYPDVNDNQYFRIKLSRDQDVLFLDNGFSNYRYAPPASQKHRMVHYFLDRAIYRPGQTVYFKAILLEREESGDAPQLVTNEKITITLYDANGQEVSSRELITSDYGTVNGTFIAPAAGLLGQMSLRSDFDGQQYFRVEEYKRPRFEVTFEPLESQAQLGGTVSVTGKAMGFAGDNVQDGQVTYRVVREVRYPWLPWWRRSRFPFPGTGSPSMEIANGQLKTGEDGTFEIEFEAIPDPGVDKNRQPAFIYTVYADVTDLTGETHSGEKSIQLAYLGLQADIQVPEATDRQDSLRINIAVKNLDGQVQAVDGQLTIERLLAPGHPYLERYWDRPDYHVMDKETFTQQFPLFAYEDEDQPQNWPVVGSLYSDGINTGNTKELELDTRDWPTGHYRLTFVTEDAEGQEIKAEQLFQLYDRSAQQIPTDQWLWTQLDQSQYEPQELANLAIATSIENWHLLYQVDRRQSKEAPHWVRLEKWLDMNELVREEDRGNFHIRMAAVRYNRVFNRQVSVIVPWSNKQLKIEYTTFRDKVRPGDKEEWQLKISGPQGEQVAAEMVASMYDASLDQFVPHNWHFSPFPNYHMDYRSWQGGGFESTGSNWLSNPQEDYLEVPDRIYRQLDQGIRFADRRYKMARGRSAAAPMAEVAEESAAMEADSGLRLQNAGAPEPAPYAADDEAPGGEKPESEAAPEEAPVTPRTNLNETVFFLPDLKTDAEGNVIVSFTMNEALTRWKFMAFAHTTDLAYAISERELVTQKELMVLPSPPRFFREGDDIFLAAKVSNLSEGPLSGTAQLELFDALTHEPVDLSFGNDQATVSFETKAGGSAGLEWKLHIPAGKTSAVAYRITARAGNFSDGEEAVLPVLTNRMLVTESQPLALNGGENKTFEITGLQEALSSPTAKAHQFTLEFTSNPAWYAVQALPYLMEYPYECTEQIFNRYYANAVASSAANQYPKVREVFNQWRDEGQDAMLSNLRKNQDLKAVLLEETPWVLAAKSEEEQKQNIGLLFDLDRMSREEENTLAKLEERQGQDGSFSWFPGGRESWHMTQYVVQGIGRLRKLNIADPAYQSKTDRISLAAMEFLDEQLKEQYKRLAELVKEQKTTWAEDHLNSLTIHYLYTRSLFDIPAEEDLKEIIEYYLGQTEKYWIDKGLYEQGLIALALANRQRMDAPVKILASLRERALRHEELGMYWKYPNSWFWYQLPIETHSLLIEVFSTLQAPAEDINALKIWLLKNKQTNHWPTTTATAAAVYALLNTGDNWLAESQEVKISFPGWNKKNYADQIDAAQASAEAGTGYFSVRWNEQEVETDITRIKVKNPNKGPAWGAAYWQYFEDLDKIKTFEETPLTLKKQLFLEKAGDRGPVLEAVNENTALQQGDKLIIRLELRVDRTMEYVHMKDTRAAGLEPINVLSTYRWQDGLGYYESPGDAATNFFMDQLPVGTYVFEYPVRVTYKGDFSNGITSIQCMYAPEFTSHSEGGRIAIE
jgi:uncharacterized protein YfaS (alpha-2-macroglobulin family)